ncbi:hypothetical protein JB92DRAFT_2209760 [Gautieria morchelliformis]|nr:hypothetical protein JB92DRAFT_2209760 [Gautieria morchelliformis]
MCSTFVCTRQHPHCTSATVVVFRLPHSHHRIPRGQAAGAYLGVDLAFDICVFVLTMVKAGQTLVHRRGPALLRRISQDGAIYFFVIFSSNAVWFFMVLFATPELKYINALPATILDVTMINRLTMNLRSNSEQGLIGETGNRSVSTPVFACCGPRTAKHSHGTRSYGTSVSGPSDSMSGSYELGAIRSERQAKA